MQSATALRPLDLVVITGDAEFLGRAVATFLDLVGAEALRVHAEASMRPEGTETPPEYLATLDKARRCLDRSRVRPRIHVLQFSSLERAADALAERSRAPDASEQEGPLGMLILDAASTGLDTEPASALDHAIDEFFDRLSGCSPPPMRSPYNTVVYRSRPPSSEEPVYLPSDRHILRFVRAGEPWLLRAEILFLFLEFFNFTFKVPRNHDSAVTASPTTLGRELVRFFVARAGSRWNFYSFTGSVVSALIDHLERATAEHGALSLRGPSEHALACAAMANHELGERPFLLVVTSGMLDEFRGTLANLREAGAKGIIVCAEVRGSQWFGFQGTQSVDEDMRDVLAARRIPHVYIEEPAGLRLGLEEAFRLYESGRGPVVLLVTASVLDARSPLPVAPVHPEPPRAAPVTPESSKALDDVLDLLNHGRLRILWQCGRLSDEERGMVLKIAERAGIALADSLTHPGSVPGYRHGAPVPSYLGMLGLYGISDRVYAFMHAQGKLRERSELCVFFVKSKLAQSATPFSEAARRNLRMVQVTRRADHIAPHVELPVVMDVSEFLAQVLRRLDVAPDVLHYRLSAIEALPRATNDLASALPSLPMSPNYFFRRLGSLVEQMIAEDGYAYTGVYDVGRCGISAMSRVPRTGPGFSGWYGRALMGDALMAVPALAVTSPNHVLAFIGDGARALVPDPLPSLVENVMTHPAHADKNVTVFTLANGCLSLIQAYRQRLFSKWGGRQMRTPILLEPDSRQHLGPLELVRRTMTTFEPQVLREALLARRRVNLFTVLLDHNTAVEGNARLAGDTWQLDSLDPQQTGELP